MSRPAASHSGEAACVLLRSFYETAGRGWTDRAVLQQCGREPQPSQKKRSFPIFPRLDLKKPKEQYSGPRRTLPPMPIRQVAQLAARAATRDTRHDTRRTHAHGDPVPYSGNLGLSPTWENPEHAEAGSRCSCVTDVAWRHQPVQLVHAEAPL